MVSVKPVSIAEGIHYCIANAERYFKSARLLKSRDRQTSYLLCLYALEEMGKIPLIWNILFYSDSEIKWMRWKKRFKNHEEKFWFSKDLDDFAKGNLAGKNNSKDLNMASEKLDVAYVNLNGTRFKPPKNITEGDIDAIQDLCKNRLLFLHKNHQSVPEDEKIVAEGYARLEGLSREHLEKMAEEFKSKK